jgi:hypothetical protein
LPLLHPRPSTTLPTHRVEHSRQPAAFRSRQPTRRAVYAKRSAQGSAKYDCAFNILDYQTTLTIFLKQTNDTAILATFNYEMNSCSWLTKGDRLALRREAEAIAALATERLAMSACRACGTPASDESLFCRRCGK